MTSGFHLKLMQPSPGNPEPVWEPDSANRVWRPADGALLWLKSGQCDVRSKPLALTPVALQVLYSSRLADPPQFTLTDLVEQCDSPISASGSLPYAGSSLFKVSSYSVQIYPEHPGN